MNLIVAVAIVLLNLYVGKHSVNHVFLSPTSIINFTSKKQSYDDTRRSSRDNELLQRAQINKILILHFCPHFPYKFIYRVAKLAENDITCSLVVCFI